LSHKNCPSSAVRLPGRNKHDHHLLLSTAASVHSSGRHFADAMVAMSSRHCCSAIGLATPQLGGSASTTYSASNFCFLCTLIMRLRPTVIPLSY
jgi:hypothetical protein